MVVFIKWKLVTMLILNLSGKHESALLDQPWTTMSTRSHGYWHKSASCVQIALLELWVQRASIFHTARLGLASRHWPEGDLETGFFSYCGFCL